MIQKMFKYSFLIYHREYEDFLEMLQELGVVHIAERTNPREVAELSSLAEERRELAQLLRQLPAGDDVAPLIATEVEGRAIRQTIETALTEERRLEARIAQLRGQCAEQSVWGDFDLSRVKALAERGYTLSLYSIPNRLFTDEYIDTHGAVSVALASGTRYFARIERPGDTPAIDAERVRLPETRLSELEERLADTTKALDGHHERIERQAPQWRADLSALDRLLTDRYTLGAARLQATPQAGDTLMYLEGWIPSDIAPDMEASLSSTGYYYRQAEIIDEDKIPIKLRNGVLARYFEPITELFSLPNYREIDQTVLIAPFFMLFFGLCLGDGGYGLLIFLIASFLRWRMPQSSMATALGLLQWLGAGGAIVGFAVGTFFGITLGYAEDKAYLFHQDNMMIIAILLGVVQIFLGKGVAAYKIYLQRGLQYALAPIAWIVFLLAIGVIMVLPQIEISLPSWVEYILYGITALTTLVILFYNSPGKNPLINAGSALWTAYNVVSGLLGDTLSYIRLFAIGLAGGILGGVFNTLGVEYTSGLPIYVRIPAILIILTLGHGLNMALAMISSLVHPMRLTFVEYYKNSEFEGGGKPYAPLRSIGIKSNN